MAKQVKQKTAYVCQNCGYQTAKWQGQCPECLAWNTFEETLLAAVPTSFKLSPVGSTVTPEFLNKIPDITTTRVAVGISEFDRVLGGGLVAGQVILLTGEPGIGKSTLLTQIAKSMSPNIVVYVCGEENPSQIKIRSSRMEYAADNLLIVNDTNTESVISTLHNLGEYQGKISLIIVDSIQTMTSSDLTGVAGSIGQVRTSSQALINVAKNLKVPTILVGHVTKDGTVAGPKVLEHMVDTVIYLEGDSQHLFRILKTTKNRFGAISEVGIFEMQGTGLVEIKNPAQMFLSEHLGAVSGSCKTVLMEGTRPLVFEIQALAAKTSFGYPRRTASGFNSNRLLVLIAVLQKVCKVDFSNHDIYLNVAGGYKVNEYACDLAICLALYSALKDQPISADVIAYGECGLLGEVRQVTHSQRRDAEAKKLGFSKIISPSNCKVLSEATKKAFQ